mmetsp:Transcript_5651/g.10075  ORF Transcript_5651/g.10075 Transcript_5651/m.10075 type:complete len:360 (-) Transcript_5651:75-1154(-)
MLAKPIVLDNGSSAIKAGFAEDSEPRVEFEFLNVDTLGGRHAQDGARAGQPVPLRRPVMVHGIVRKWEALEACWQEVFDMLNVKPQDYPVFVSEAPLNPITHKEKLVETLFEFFNVPSAQVVHSGALALFGTGSSTGLVIEVGDGVAQTVPLYNSYLMFNAVNRRNFGGRDLTDYLSKLLKETVGFDAGVDLKPVSDMKGSLALKNNVADQKTFELPDGKVVDCGQFSKCPEALFQPSLLDLDGSEERPGIHQLAYDSISKCARDIQRDITKNIVLAGGSMLFPGMVEKVEEELKALLPRVTVRASLLKNPRHATFKGGSVVASMPDAQKSFMTKAEYEENGAAYIHEKSISLTQPPRR